MRILICGSRDFNNYQMLAEKLSDILWKRKFDSLTVIHGKARGADALGGLWAVAVGAVVEEYPADWSKHGRKAGPIRNQQMLDEGKPDLVVAFPQENSIGTYDMIRRAQKAGVETLVFVS